jgi:N-acetylneuraminate synthase
MQDKDKITKIIGEIGINYATGDDMTKFLDNAKKLIDSAVLAGCDFVKFQKRNPDKCVPIEQRHVEKIVPWRDEPTTYLQYKKDIEFGKREYNAIDKYCNERGIKWFASVWDLDSVDFMEDYGCGYMKIPSALITDLELCKHAGENCTYLMVSTGMSSEEEIEACVEACNPDLIFHTNSSYPAPIEELNLNYITWLKDKYEHIEIGYSGHEWGLTTTFGAVVLGATWIERHITLDRTLWGSDQSSSVEPIGLMKLVKGVRDIELATQYEKAPRQLFTSELAKRKSLRGE